MWDPFIIAEEKGIDVRYVVLEDKPLGMYVEHKNKQFILLNNILLESPTRYFVCAHELFHATEHDGMIGYYTSHTAAKNKLEYAANQHALKMLINLYKEWVDKETITLYEVMEFFEVPEEVYKHI